MYLNAHTYYSLRYGTLSAGELVGLAKENNLQALALTDINNSTGVPEFIRECRENGIKPVTGIEFRDGDEFLYAGIARNREGMRELNEYVTYHNRIGKPFPPYPKRFHNAYVIYPLGKKITRALRENELIGVRPREVRKLLSTEYHEKRFRLVIRQPVVFRDSSDFELHKNLRAVDHNILISQLKDNQAAEPSDYMIPPGWLCKIYEDYPEIIRNTEKILDECGVDFDFSTVKNKRSFTGSVYDDRKLLDKLASEGMEHRYGSNNTTIKERLRHELNIIHKMGFDAYFLITWDIIRYSMSRGYYHVCRGSGANSVAAYCLKITNVDPIGLNLYFERFINPRRSSPPDFDIDYSWDERDDVLDYIFKRYGRKHTALLGTISTFRGRSIYRELGKVHGLPKEEIDALVRNPDAEINKNEITQKICQLGEKLVDFPNLRSIHAGGVLISEEPLDYFTALDLPPKGFPTTQWDMYTAEEIGFEKLDILSQRGIGHIREAAEIIRKNRGENIDVFQIDKFKKDEKVKRQLKTGETNGCFYIESPAMRGLLKKLQCEDYLTLVAASSIIRPGVARSGMMKEYVRRFHNPTGFSYLHPVMEAQLKETYGVMVYQEDVLKVCHHFAGLDMADADILRRAMSGKYRSRKEMERIVDTFFSNCRERGYPEKLTREVWRQIESFAGYSFSKAHSASYAVESYQSLYLKAHYPLEFMTAVINNFGGFYASWVYFNEARRQGAEIHTPCVNNSDYKTGIKGNAVYIGFIHVENLEKQIGEWIPGERSRNGDFRGLGDFIQRVPASKEQLTILIRTGAFRFTGKSKAHLLWEAHIIPGKKTPIPKMQKLFITETKNFKLPELEYNPLEDAYDELELLDFPVSLSWFGMLKTAFRGEVMAKDLSKFTGKKVRMMGVFVTMKYVRTVKKEIMNFGTFLDAEGEFFDTVHFPDSLKHYTFRGRGVYLVLGKVVEEFGFPGLEVEKMAKMPLREDPRG